MSTLTAITWVFALLLVVAGARKLSRPAATGAALQVARLPSDARLVRALGAGEVALGGTVLAAGGAAPTAVLAVAYAAFAVFAEHQRRQGAGCGCFGAATTPATRLHVWLNAGAAAVAAGAALQPGASLPTALTTAPSTGVLAAGLLIVAASLLRLLLTAAPDLSAAVALVEPRSDT